MKHVNWDWLVKVCEVMCDLEMLDWTRDEEFNLAYALDDLKMLDGGMYAENNSSQLCQITVGYDDDLVE